jgi:uncharacterized protein YndB with AHSA1/START domain
VKIMETLSHRLDRSIRIEALPDTVFGFFTDSVRWAKWWGAGSSIDARPGGKILIRHPNGIEVLGEVMEIALPKRLVFTYGYANGVPIPPGGSRVTIQLAPEEQGTRLHLFHEFADSAMRDHHVQGWRFQLSLFGNVVANEVHVDASSVVDAWFQAWAIPDDGARQDAFARIAATDVAFRDRYSLLDGLDDLSAHAGAAQKYMPGIAMNRKGEIRHCQGTVLADWAARASDGSERMSGTNVFVLGSDGRIRSVTGFAH